MSNDVKRCVQCGMLKPVVNFRKYTYAEKNDTEGRYRVCKSCEAINQSYRRAKLAEQNRDDVDASWDASQEVKRIEKLYDVLAARGLRVPNQKPTVKPVITDDIEKLLQFYEADNTQQSATILEQEVRILPAELQELLDVPDTYWAEHNMSPEYLQETLYESLKAKYRPLLRIDKDTMLPVYDDTYKDVLNKILQRFDEYEESFQKGGE